MNTVDEIIKDEKYLYKKKRRNLSSIGNKVNSYILCLQKRYLSEDSRKHARARADLANLRRGLTAGPGERVEIWDLTQVDVSDNAPDEPTREEFAVHVAMTLYAAHQQSRTKPMHRPGEGLGHAAHSVVGYGEDENPSARARFDALVMSSTPRELRRHLRSFVSLLRAKEIPLDYGMLVDDIVCFQRPGGAKAVRRHWSRQYYDFSSTDGESSETDSTAEDICSENSLHNSLTNTKE